MRVSGSGASIFRLQDYPWCLQWLTWLSASSVCSVYSAGPAGLIGPSTEGLDPNSARGPLNWEEIKWSLGMAATSRRFTKRQNQSKDFTSSLATRRRGIQIHRAQRLSGHIDVVDMVEDYGLFLQRLIGLRCLSSNPGGTNQLVASWWSSRSDTLEADNDFTKTGSTCPRLLVLFSFYIYIRHTRPELLGLLESVQNTKEKKKIGSRH